MSLVSSDPDRYLKRRGRGWHCIRRVPKHAQAYDGRGAIQVSRQITSQEVARLKQDNLEKADELYWSGVADGVAAETAFARFEAAKIRAFALGFDYRTAERIGLTLPVEEMVRRIEAAAQTGAGDP